MTATTEFVPEKAKTGRLARNSALGAVAGMSTSLSSFLCGIIVARALGVAGTGTVAYIIWIVVTLAPVVDIGMQASIGRYTPEFRGRGEHALAETLSGYLYRVLLCSVGVAVAIVALVASFPAHNGEQLMLVTDQAKLIRTTVGDIRVAGRNTQGVTIFRVADDEHVVSAARIEESDDEAEADLGDTAEAPETDPQTGGEGLVDPVVLVGGEGEVAVEGTVGQRRRLADHRARVLGPPQPDGAEAARVRDRGGKAGVDGHRRRDDRVRDLQQLADRRLATHRDGAASGAPGIRGIRSKRSLTARMG